MAGLFSGYLPFWVAGPLEKDTQIAFAIKPTTGDRTFCFGDPSFHSRWV